jgi:hypothetical protein
MPVAGVKDHTSDEACVPDARAAPNMQPNCKKRAIGNEAVSGTLPPMTKAPSTALSARSNGLDNIDGSPERGVYT